MVTETVATFFRYDNYGFGVLRIRMQMLAFIVHIKTVVFQNICPVFTA